MDTQKKYFKNDGPNKQNSDEVSSNNYSADRRKILKTMGKLAYIAPALSVISLPKNASAFGSLPFPGDDQPLDPSDPRIR